MSKDTTDIIPGFFEKLMSINYLDIVSEYKDVFSSTVSFFSLLVSFLTLIVAFIAYKSAKEWLGEFIVKKGYSSIDLIRGNLIRLSIINEDICISREYAIATVNNMGMVISKIIGAEKYSILNEQKGITVKYLDPVIDRFNKHYEDMFMIKSRLMQENINVKDSQGMFSDEASVIINEIKIDVDEIIGEINSIIRQSLLLRSKIISLDFNDSLNDTNGESNITINTVRKSVDKINKIYENGLSERMNSFLNMKLNEIIINGKVF
ncbi:hypothetical protein [Serratia fonticola]